MQVTELQVQRSLDALTEQNTTTVVSARVPQGVGTSTDTIVADGDTPDGDSSTEDLRQDLVAQLSLLPAVRDDRLAEARRRLETGERPTDEALAHRMVGRLVCDRLR